MQGRNGMEGKILKYEIGAMALGAFGSVCYRFDLFGLSAKHYAVLVVFCLYFCLGRYIMECTTAPPMNDPHTYCKRILPNKRKKSLVCLGDSITHQGLSGEFVRMLREAREDLDVVNCGQNSILTHTVLKERVAWVNACKPDYVNLMIGTNDVKGIYKKEWGEGSKVTWHINEDISYEQFGSNFERILESLYTGGSAKIIVCTLPPMGEDLSCAANEHIKKANAIILKICKKYRASNRVVVADVFTSLSEYLNKNTTAEYRKKGLKVDNFESVGPACALKKYVLGKDYDEIGRASGLRLMIDALHLNTTGAAIVAKDILKELK